VVGEPALRLVVDGPRTGHDDRARAVAAQRVEVLHLGVGIDAGVRYEHPDVAVGRLGQNAARYLSEVRVGDVVQQQGDRLGRRAGQHLRPHVRGVPQPAGRLPHPLAQLIAHPMGRTVEDAGGGGHRDTGGSGDVGQSGRLFAFHFAEATDLGKALLKRS
jgi:hypothetical protein